MHRLLPLLALCGALPLPAQSNGPVDKGSILLSGSASIRRATHESGGSKSTITGLSLNPNLLYFVAPRVALGGQVALSTISFDGGSGSAWQVGPAARVYFAPSSAKALPFIGAGVLFGRNTTENDVTHSKSTSDVWGLEGVVGLTAMVTRQVGITSEVYLERTTDDSEVGTTSVEQKRTEYGLRFGIAAFLFR